MTINVIRGQNRIGGSIIEIATARTRIILDAGIELDEGADFAVPPVPGLFSGEAAYDAVFVSHYHGDHMGLLDCVLDGIPVYMGETAWRMVCAAGDYRNEPVRFRPRFIHDREKITVGDIALTPFSCDHSALDSYMFLLEGEGRRVLYTGDFRGNGRLGDDGLLSALPTVDAVIIEGTTLSRDDARENTEEALLEEIAVSCLKDRPGPAFIMMSPMNTDRLITAYNAARRTGRTFLEDIYTASVACAAGEEIPQPNGKHPARVFMTGGDRQYEKLQAFGNAKIGKAGIAGTPFLMCVRASMQNYLSRLNERLSFENGTLFYGMWKGYLAQPAVAEFVQFMEERGAALHVLHTSGHADSGTIDRLIRTVAPAAVIPVHTENADWFLRYEPEIRAVRHTGIISL